MDVRGLVLVRKKGRGWSIPSAPFFPHHGCTSTLIDFTRLQQCSFYAIAAVCSPLASANGVLRVPLFGFRTLDLLLQVRASTASSFHTLSCLDMIERGLKLVVTRRSLPGRNENLRAERTLNSRLECTLRTYSDALSVVSTLGNPSIPRFSLLKRIL